MGATNGTQELQLNDFASRMWPLLNLAPRTRGNYEGAYRRYIQPTIGHLELSSIAKADLVDLLAPLPPQTKYQTLMTLRTLFRAAHERELITDNPTERIAAPRVQPKPQKFLTLEEVMGTHFGRHTDGIRFIALHGLRWSEAAAVTHDDIRDGRVHVTKSLHGPTKSAAGVRSVPYMGHFPGEWPSRTPIARALAKHDVTIHSLRRTYAYTLKTAGVHVTTAAKLLGHSNPAITMKIYTGVLDHEIDHAGDAMRALMQSPQQHSADRGMPGQMPLI